MIHMRWLTNDSHEVLQSYRQTEHFIQHSFTTGDVYSTLIAPNMLTAFNPQLFILKVKRITFVDLVCNVQCLSVGIKTVLN